MSKIILHDLPEFKNNGFMHTITRLSEPLIYFCFALFLLNPHPMHLYCYFALVIYVYPIKELSIHLFLLFLSKKEAQPKPLNGVPLSVS